MGNLTYIVGPSKIGKTVLCENVIGQENMISMSGNDFSKERDFWSGVGRKAGISMNAEVSEENAFLSHKQQKTTTIKKNYLTAKDLVIDFFVRNNKVLVLDDFHYAPPDIQYDIACQLKEVIRQGFKAVIISLPYRSDDAIRLNPDLTGRILLIEIEPWKKEELKKIAEKGFAELKISVPEDLIDRRWLRKVSTPPSLCRQSV